MKFVTSTFAVSLVLLSTVSTVRAESPGSFTDLLSQSTAAAIDGRWSTGASLSRRLLALPDLTATEVAVGYSHLCTHLTNLQDFDRAARACNKSVVLEPTEARTYINRGNFRLASGDKTGAVLDYKKAQALKPSAIVPGSALTPETPSTYIVPTMRISGTQIAEAAAE